MEAHCPRLRTQASHGRGRPDLASLLPRLHHIPVKREWVGVGLLWEIAWLQAEIPSVLHLPAEKALRSHRARGCTGEGTGPVPTMFPAQQVWEGHLVTPAHFWEGLGDVMIAFCLVIF